MGWMGERRLLRQCYYLIFCWKNNSEPIWKGQPIISLLLHYIALILLVYSSGDQTALENNDSTNSITQLLYWIIMVYWSTAAAENDILLHISIFRWRIITILHTTTPLGVHVNKGTTILNHSIHLRTPLQHAREVCAPEHRPLAILLAYITITKGSAPATE